MDGMATFTMLVSSTDMNMPTTTTASGSPHLTSAAAPDPATPVPPLTLLSPPTDFAGPRSGSMSGSPGSASSSSTPVRSSRATWPPSTAELLDRTQSLYGRVQCQDLVVRRTTAASGEPSPRDTLDRPRSGGSAGGEAARLPMALSAYRRPRRGQWAGPELIAAAVQDALRASIVIAIHCDDASLLDIQDLLEESTFEVLAGKGGADLLNHSRRRRRPGGKPNASQPLKATTPKGDLNWSFENPRQSPISKHLIESSSPMRSRPGLAGQLVDLLVGELHLRGPHVVFQVHDRGSAGDRQDHRRAPQKPGQCELRGARVVVARELIEHATSGDEVAGG